MDERESTYVRTVKPSDQPPRPADTGQPRPEEVACRRLAGRRWFSGQSLYATDEFLLCVNGGVFQETYRRFYYRDIQAILLRRSGSNSGLIVLSTILLVLSAVAAANSLMSPAPLSVPIFWLTVAALSAVGLTWSLVSQGQCVCYIQTPVSIQRLPVTNVRAAKRLMSELSPHIEAAQAALQNDAETRRRDVV